MIRDELLTRPGTWQLELRAGTPQSIRDACRAAARERRGFIVQFPSRVTTPTIELAAYAGPVTKYNGRGMAGTGMAGLLQTDDDIGTHVTDNRSTNGDPRSLSDWMDVVLPFGSITKGTEYGTGPPNQVPGYWWMGLGGREIIDHVFALAQADVQIPVGWRVNPTGAMDFGYLDIMMNSEPVVIVQPGASATRRAGQLTAMPGDITRYNLDGSLIAQKVVAYGSGFGDGIPTATATASTTVAYGADAAALNAIHPIQAAGTEQTELQNQADEAVARVSKPIETFEVRTFQPNVRQDVEPGDVVFVYAPTQNVLGEERGEDGIPALDQAIVDGRVVIPKRVRVTSMRTESVDGEAFWLFDSPTATWAIDLTPYVITRTGESRWSVTSDLGVAGIAGLQSPNRLDITTDPNPNPPPPVAPPIYNPGPSDTNPQGLELGYSY